MHILKSQLLKVKSLNILKVCFSLNFPRYLNTEYFLFRCQKIDFQVKINHGLRIMEDCLLFE